MKITNAKLVANTRIMSNVCNSLLFNMLVLIDFFSFLFLSFFGGKIIEISIEYACFDVAIACE